MSKGNGNPEKPEEHTPEEAIASWKGHHTLFVVIFLLVLIVTMVIVGH